MAPTLRELFGDPSPIPPNQLKDEALIRKELTGQGKMFDSEEKLIEGRLQTVYKNIPPTARVFWQMCGQAYSKKTYLVYQGEQYTYQETYQLSIQAAFFLRSRFQVRKGDRVGIGARNYPEFVISFWAIHLLGAVACPLNSFNDGDTLAFCIQDVNCRAVIIDGERYDRLQPYLSKLQKGTQDAALHAVVVLPRMGTRRPTEVERQKWKGKEGVYEWEDLMAETAKVVDAPVVIVDPEDNATILFTSGTTGRPKGVLSSQRQYMSTLVISGWVTARALTRRHRTLPPPPAPNDPDQGIALILVPLMHVTGLLSGLTSYTSTGTKVCLMPTYSKKAAIEIIQREKVSSLLGVGWMVREIAKSDGDLSSIQVFSHGGAPSAKEMVSELAQKNPNALPTHGYGMSELNGSACNVAADDYHAKPASAGCVHFGMEAVVVDPDTGIRLPSNQRGELWIKSPGRAKCYWNRPKESKEVFLQDGWLRTGDMAYIDSEGSVFIVDRLKDIIIRGGENIACSQVENAVYNCRSILDCTAVSLPEPSMGERVAVVCVVAEGVEMPTQEEVIKAASKSLPRVSQCTNGSRL